MQKNRPKNLRCILPANKSLLIVVIYFSIIIIGVVEHMNSEEYKNIISANSMSIMDEFVSNETTNYDGEDYDPYTLVSQENGLQNNNGNGFVNDNSSLGLSVVKNETYTVLLGTGIDNNEVIDYINIDNLTSNVIEVNKIAEEKAEQERIRLEQEAIEKERIEAENAKKADEAAKQAQLDAGFLVATSNPDPSYVGRPVQVDDRYLLECLVTGEYGNDYIGAVLVAQTIRDTMIEENNYCVKDLIVNHKYSGRTNKGTTDIAKRAVAFVFDQGGSGVQHKLKCFYASNICSSSWHEKQEFVYQHNYVRFFYY